MLSIVEDEDFSQGWGKNPGTGRQGLQIADYRKLAALLTRSVGIRLNDDKRTMLEARLWPRLRALGYADHNAYCHYLFEEAGLMPEMAHLIDAVTTNKTDFFREVEHFDLMRKTLVPELLALRARESQPLIKVWSAASSNGSEAYTIGMVLADLASRHHFRHAVLGTDISTRMLAEATRAVYGTELVAPVPTMLRERYLLKSRDGTSVRVVPELRRLTRFVRLNLMDQRYPFDEDIDVVFLRNVLIYFEREDQRAVIERLLGHVRRGGFLILGHSEAMIGTSMGLCEVAPSVFRKR